MYDTATCSRHGPRQDIQTGVVNNVFTTPRHVRGTDPDRLDAVTAAFVLCRLRFKL